MGVTQNEKAMRFRGLHGGPGAFVIPNPWDVGSAQVLAGLGFKALATSSAASAGALGRKDHGLTRDEALAHARMIVGATDLLSQQILEKDLVIRRKLWAKRSSSQPMRDLLGARLRMRLETKTSQCTISPWLSNESLQLRRRHAHSRFLSC